MRRRFIALLFSGSLAVLATAAIAQVFNPPADPNKHGTTTESKLPPNSLPSPDTKPDFPAGVGSVSVLRAAESQVGPVYNYNYSYVTSDRLQPGVVDLVEKWKLAQDKADREKIEQSIQAALKEQFQARLESNEKEISQLEAEVKRLRGQLDLRRKKQAEIIEFRLTQLLREAQGLGWGTEPEMRPDAARMGTRPGAIGGYYPVRVEPGRSLFSPTPKADTVSPAGQPVAPAPAERTNSGR